MNLVKGGLKFQFRAERVQAMEKIEEQLGAAGNAKLSKERLKYLYPMTNLESQHSDSSASFERSTREQS